MPLGSRISLLAAIVTAPAPPENVISPLAVSPVSDLKNEDESIPSTVAALPPSALMVAQVKPPVAPDCLVKACPLDPLLDIFKISSATELIASSDSPTALAAISFAVIALVAI